MPVTIPPFTNVPSPNDPVKSDWAQQLTQFAVDQYLAQPGQPASAYTELWYDTDDAGMAFPNMPRGYVGAAQLAADQSVASASGIVDITGCSVTWTADPSRIYRTIVVIGAADHSVAAGQQTVYIRDASNANKRVHGTAAGSTDRRSHTLVIDESGLSGSQTRKASIAASAGTIVLAASGGAAPYAPRITVEDIGAAGQSGGGVWSDKFPRGLIGQSVGAATDTALTNAGWQDVAGMSVTFTPSGPNRWVKFTFMGSVKMASATATVIAGIHDGSTQAFVQEIGAPNTATFVLPFSLIAVRQLATQQAYTYKPQIYANGANVTLMGAGGRTPRFIIEDVGGY